MKKSALVLIVLGYILNSVLITVLPVSAAVRRKARTRNTSFFSKLALALFGVRVVVKHPDQLYKDCNPRLIVSNHLSYIDVLVISSIMPSVFITSVELKQAPLLGTLARFGGSLFVERRKPSGLKQEIEAIAGVLEEGFSVVLFPEGTTSNGDRVQPFKNSLFDAAIMSKACVLPLCLRYTEINGEPLSLLNRDTVFYYGGVSFISHFPRFLRLESVTIETTVLKNLEPLAHASRKELASRAHEAIGRAFYTQGSTQETGSQTGEV